MWFVSSELGQALQPTTGLFWHREVGNEWSTAEELLVSGPILKYLLTLPWREVDCFSNRLMY
jgi:hypothetical protein